MHPVKHVVILKFKHKELFVSKTAVFFADLVGTMLGRKIIIVSGIQEVRSRERGKRTGRPPLLSFCTAAFVHKRSAELKEKKRKTSPKKKSVKADWRP